MSDFSDVQDPSSAAKGKRAGRLPQQERSQTRIAKVLAAAEQLLAEIGADAASIPEISSSRAFRGRASTSSSLINTCSSLTWRSYRWSAWASSLSRCDRRRGKTESSNRPSRARRGGLLQRQSCCGGLAHARQLHPDRPQGPRGEGRDDWIAPARFPAGPGHAQGAAATAGCCDPVGRDRLRLHALRLCVGWKYQRSDLHQATEATIAYLSRWE